eukprot:NODE_4785_length_765_cov_6.405028_g3989_i0.p4 GENE.NODE_4785_length_765_cov_6.405028_g3989_i0~~NODE_4785_length_765_cov_6.405028_g3989_i0.p4  ORF type:complete len:68 (-),score=7.56 NODE_4785_length_765_cov_6.405028_g3989_i0:83-286(-)
MHTQASGLDTWPFGPGGQAFGLAWRARCKHLTLHPMALRALGPGQEPPAHVPAPQGPAGPGKGGSAF